jgi:hypothetical protein
MMRAVSRAYLPTAQTRTALAVSGQTDRNEQVLTGRGGTAWYPAKTNFDGGKDRARVNTRRSFIMETKSFRVWPSEQGSTTVLWESFGWKLESAYDVIKPETPRSPGYHLVELRFKRNLSWRSYAELVALEEKAKAANLGHEQEKALLGDGFDELKLQKLTEEVRANPNSASAYYTRGREYSKQGKNAEAVADLTKAAELEPANDTYRAALEGIKREIAKKAMEDEMAIKLGGKVILFTLIGVAVIIGIIIYNCSH